VRTALHEGLLCGDLDQLETVRLTGTRCRDCGEVSLGERNPCPNCGGEAVGAITLAAEGSLWGFTVIRHRPPGEYPGPEPFQPFGLGLVELPEGLRVVSPIAADLAALKIGMTLKFEAYARATPEGERVLFRFVPTR
jgi:uncharacterized OB-fold protein